MQDEITIDATDLIHFLRRGLLLALAIGGIAGFAVLQLSLRQDPVYEAEASVLAAQTVPEFRQFGYSLVTAPPLDPSAYAVAGRSDPVLIDALSRMGVNAPTRTDIDRLRGRIAIRTEITRSSSLINVRGRGTTPEAAANRANAVANALVAWDKSRSTESLELLEESIAMQIESISEQIRSLQTLQDPAVADQITGLISLRAQRQQDLSSARTLSASATSLLQVLQLANPPTRQVAPRPMFNAALAFLVGVVLAYALQLLRRVLDTRLRDAEDLTVATGLPVLAEFPRLQRGDRALLREASSYLRTNLLFSTPEAHPKVFLVTSAQGGEGKSVTASSLAEGFVRNGYRTLLVDADLRSPSIARSYRIASANRASFPDWLQDPYRSHAPVEVAISPKQVMYVIPTFQPVQQAAELLSRGFRTCLEKWRDEFDVIILDSAPVLAVADSLTIAPLCTGTVLVTHLQKTDRRQVRTAVDLLRRIGVRVLGLVATHVTAERGVALGYGYGAPATPEERPAVRPTATATPAPPLREAQARRRGPGA